MTSATGYVRMLPRSGLREKSTTALLSIKHDKDVVTPHLRKLAYEGCGELKKHFRKELTGFLRETGIEFDERYLA